MGEPSIFVGPSVARPVGPARRVLSWLAITPSPLIAPATAPEPTVAAEADTFVLSAAADPDRDDAPAPLLAMPPEPVALAVRRVPSRPTAAVRPVPAAVPVAVPVPVLPLAVEPDTQPAPAPMPRIAVVPAVTDPAEGALTAILLAPLQFGETTMVGYLRKEHEMRAVFAALSVPAARLLHARLSAGKADDALGAAFARMTLDRRTRLLVFLADARRREALSNVRR